MSAETEVRPGRPAVTAGETMRRARERAGTTRADLAGVCGVPEAEIAAMEDHLERVTVTEWDPFMAALDATAPPRPDWWEEGADHDASLGVEDRGDPALLDDAERAYWAGIDAWKAEPRRGGWWQRRERTTRT